MGTQAILRAITAYNGWLILEYSQVVEGKPKSRFVIQPPPDGPITVGDSLKEAKHVIDGLSEVPNHGLLSAGQHSSTAL